MKPYLKMVIVACIIIAAGAVVYLGWNWLAGPSPAPVNQQSSAPYFPLAGLTGTSTSQTQASASGTPAVAAGTLTKVSDRPAAFFWTEPGTGEVFYLDQSGIVWQAEASQKNPQITQQGVAAVNSIEQSPDGNSILAAFGAPQNPSWGIYDTIDQVWRPLPADILEAAWGADSNTLIATVQNGTNINLVTLDLTKTPPRPKVMLSDMRLLDTTFRFLPPNTLLIEERADANYGGRIWGLNLKTLALNLLIGPQNGLTARLTNDGSTLITYSAASGFQLLSSKDLQNISPIPFTTLPSKCSANSGSILYCFVPTNADFKNASLPNDYTERKLYTSDALYAIDTQNGASTLIPLPQNGVGQIDAEKPALAGSELYFINRLDGYLYALNLGNQPSTNNGGAGGDFYD